MNVLIYLLLVNLCLAASYGFYQLFLRHETFHQANRWFLLGGIAAAYLLPFLQSDFVQDFFITQKVQAAVQASAVYEVMLFLPQQNEPGLTWYDALLGVYFAGVAFGFARLAWMLYQLKKQVRKGHAGEAWSFFGLKRIDPKLAGQDMIMAHETVHSREGHSVDVLLAELLILLNWFNPVVYFVRIALRRLHEFIADAEASKHDKATYAMLLLSKQFGVNPSALAHQFLDLKQLKNRIHMMKKDPSKKSALLKYGLLLPLFGAVLILSAATNAKRNPVVSLKNAVQDLAGKEVMIHGNVIQEDKPVFNQQDTVKNGVVSFATVQTLPKFQGGDKGFADFVTKNFRMPAEAKKNNAGGRVTMSFIVEEDGKISNVKVLRDLGYGTGEEAARVLNSSPAWSPGLNADNKPVRVSYVLPIQVGASDKALDAEKSGDQKTLLIPGGNTEKPLYVMDGKPVDGISQIDSKTIASVTILKNADATAKYGERGKYGVVLVSTKKDGGINKDTAASTKKSNNIGISFQPGGADFNGLVVIDGVKKEKGTLKQLNPDDIEAINVLKGVNATSLYGSDAKNGAILITTKKSSDAEKKTDPSGESSGKSGPNEEITVVGYPSPGTSPKKGATSGKPLKAVTVVGYPNNNQQQSDLMSFASVEVLPKFPGGDKAFAQYVRDNYHIPEAATKSKSAGGRITVSFIVEMDGKLSDIKVLRDLGYGTGEEAVRMLKNMPAWSPGLQKGKPVRVAYTLPIAISLK